MKISIEAEAKEIADLVLAIQSQPCSKNQIVDELITRLNKSMARISKQPLTV